MISQITLIVALLFLYMNFLNVLVSSLIRLKSNLIKQAKKIVGLMR